MSLLTRLIGNHDIDDWQSEYTLIAARTLNQVAADLIVAAESDLAEARWKDALVNPGEFVSAKIAPRIREVAEPVALAIIAEANLALASIVDAQAVWVREPEHAELAGGSFEGASDIASAAVPFAVGVATAATLPYAAVTTTTAFLGLVSTTAISWPLVIGGTAIAGLGIATGAFNGARLWDKTQARLRHRIRTFIVTALLEGTADTPSILEQIAAEFGRAAERARKQ
jgi:hypothetical protein